MKNYFSITVSDAFGSRYYTIKKSTRRRLVYVLLLVLLVLSGSLGYNYLMYGLDRQVAQLAGHNARLGEELAAHEKMARAVGLELSEIERIGGVETGDGWPSLAQRVRAIGRFYQEKEEEYFEIGSRIEQIEEIINPMTGLPDGPRDDLAGRVETAALSIGQEKILLSSIPSGFPLDSSTVTSEFGYRVHPLTGIKSFHKGIDLRAKTPMNVRASADGIVVFAGYSKLSGNRVEVQHNFGFASAYAHLDKIYVQPGDIVHKGDVVGVSGNSGLSTAPHLHYEIRYLGKPLDPAVFLRWELGNHDVFTQVKAVKWPSLINLINKRITHQTLLLSQLEPVSQENSR